MTTVLAALAALVIALFVAGGASARGLAERFPPTGERVEIDGAALHVVRTGPRDGPPLLVLHGASGNLHEPKLALDGRFDGFRVHWLDRPGLGWSERPDGAWGPGPEARLIAAYLEAEAGGRPAVVIGHSYGAAIALRLALDHPERVAGLVLLAPAARAWVGEAAWYNKATRWPVLGTLITRAVVPTIGRSRLDDGARSAFAPEPMPEGYVEASFLPLILRASNWKANAADMAQVNPNLAAQETRYHEIEAPTAILAGPGDTVVRTDRHAVPVAQTLPNAELELIEGAGHNLHHHHPERVAEAVRAVARRAGLAPAGASGARPRDAADAEPGE